MRRVGHLHSIDPERLEVGLDDLGSRRERRAKVVNAEGEFQAAEKMVQAAAMIAGEPIALQLRYLQTMREMASEHNTTTFLPLPIDLFSAFLKK